MKSLLRNHKVLIFIFSIAVMLGPAVSVLFSFDPNTEGNTDTRTYIGLSKFDLKQSPKRKYRVIVPALAAAVNVGNPIWSKLAPRSFQGEFGLYFSFMVVNILLMAVFGVLIYRYLQTFQLSLPAIITGLLAMLTARYTAMCAGMPLAESLYFIMIAATLLGIRTKDTKMLLLAIFLGPFSKEAFVFIAPLIFFFGHISKGRQVLYFLASAALVFGFRYLFDQYQGAPAAAGLKADFGHLRNLLGNFRQLFSFRGVYGIFSVVGAWIIFITVGLKNKADRKLILNRLHCWFLVSVLVQILVSGSVDRMFYLAMPVLCLAVAVGFSNMIKRVSPAV